GVVQVLLALQQIVVDGILLLLEGIHLLEGPGDVVIADGRVAPGEDAQVGAHRRPAAGRGAAQLGLRLASTQQNHHHHQSCQYTLHDRASSCWPWARFPPPLVGCDRTNSEKSRATVNTCSVEG